MKLGVTNGMGPAAGPVARLFVRGPLLAGITAIALISIQVQPARSQAALSGEWVGVLRVRAETLYVRLGITAVANDIAVSVLSSLPRPLKVTSAEPIAPGLQLNLADRDDTMHARLELVGDTLTGRLRHRDGAGGDLTLVRTATINSALYDDYAGIYELGPGRLVFVRRQDRLSSKPPFEIERSWLQFIESSGRTRLLFPADQVSFFAGPAYAVPVPIAVRVRFVRDGGGLVTGLRWQEGDEPEAHASRLTDLQPREIRFASGDVTLAGRLLVPSGAGVHPAVVLLPGGPGPANRNENYFVTADVLASAGVATLVFDKRGTGASTGDWRRAGYKELANDALAAVRFLQRHSNINAECVGLLGFSESGWVAPLAARLSPDVAFVAVAGASGLPHAELDLTLLERALAANTVDSGERTRALELERRIVEYAMTRRGWPGVRAALDSIRASQWLGRSIAATHTGYDLPTTEQHWFWDLYAADAAYDPVPTLRDLRVPLLAIRGEYDAAAPPDLSVPRFEAARSGRSNGAFRLTVVPKGDHGLWEFPTANTAGFHLVRRVVPAYLDTLRGWFAERAAACGGKYGAITARERNSLLDGRFFRKAAAARRTATSWLRDGPSFF